MMGYWMHRITHEREEDKSRPDYPQIWKRRTDIRPGLHEDALE